MSCNQGWDYAWNPWRPTAANKEVFLNELNIWMEEMAEHQITYSSNGSIWVVYTQHYLFPILKLHAMWLDQTQQLVQGSDQIFSTFHLPKKNPKSGPCATPPCFSPSSSFSLRSKAPCHSCPNIHPQLVITVVFVLGWIVAQNNPWGGHKMAWSKLKKFLSPLHLSVPNKMMETKENAYSGSKLCQGIHFGQVQALNV